MMDVLHNIGDAMEWLKRGERAARRGWNGKDMWIALSPGHPALPANNFWSKGGREYAEAMGGTAEVLPSFIMKTADGKIQPGWSPSQADCLANDWFVLI